MEQRYKIDGMTCGGCKVSVEKHIGGLAAVDSVLVDLVQRQAVIQSKTSIPLEALQKVLPEKYRIQVDPISEEAVFNNASSEISVNQKSKLQQLYPLLLIFLYLIVSSNLLHIDDWSPQAVMLDFMGLFYIVFSFFKILDLNGFPQSFRMYDPLAKRVPFYAWVYPFLEVGLGLQFLFRFQLKWALIITLIVLSVTTFGVFKSILDKKAIRCACLGTALKLPMTEATIIENILMIGMATGLLFGGF